MYYDYLETALGKIYLLADKDGLRQLTIGCHNFQPCHSWEHNSEFLAPYVHQLAEYLEGKRHSFDLPLAPDGTPFQREVWAALQKIPFGETRSYSELAESIGQPHAAHAVGMANNVNPIPIIIPCHRVIGADGDLVGYRYGVELKQQLLALEEGQLCLVAS